MREPVPAGCDRRGTTGSGEGGIPIGSVIVHQGVIIGRGHNRRVQKGSAVLHGEMDASRSWPPACQRVPRVRSCIRLSHRARCARRDPAVRLPKVVVGENQTFMGEEGLLRSRGVSSRCCRTLPGDLMRQFIATGREL